MSATISKAKFDQILSLYELREKKLLDRIAVFRIELENLLEKLAEQKELIKTLKDELQSLHDMRSNQNIEAMSVQSFLAESSRRQWLTLDLEKEEFYLPGFETDVAQARRKLARAQRSWARMRERSKALKQKMEQQQQSERVRQTRLDETSQDERQALGVSQHG